MCLLHHRCSTDALGGERMSKIETLNNIETRIDDLVELLRALYPNFSHVPHAEAVIYQLIDARRDLGYLQDDEGEE